MHLRHKVVLILQFVSTLLFLFEIYMILKIRIFDKKVFVFFSAQMWLCIQYCIDKVPVSASQYIHFSPGYTNILVKVAIFHQLIFITDLASVWFICLVFLFSNLMIYEMHLNTS